MAKVRVHELAMEFGVEPKAVMAKLQEMGEFVRSPSSTIEAPVVRRLKAEFAPQSPEATQPGRHEGVPPQQGVAPGPALVTGSPARRSRPAPGIRSPDHQRFKERLNDRRKRWALSLSVGSFNDGSRAEPGLLSPAALPFAAKKAQALTEALTFLGYQPRDRAYTDKSAMALGREVEDAIDAGHANEILLIHVLSHGYVAESGALYVLGPDGKTHALTDVEQWLKRIENFPDCPYTLFLLDLCHGGTVARLPWQAALADGTSRAWVIAACGPDRQAFDGRFTEAATNVFNALMRGQLDIDRSIQYVPLATIAREIRREVGRIATTSGGFRQQVTCSIIDISASVDLPFFPNPNYIENQTNQVRGQVDTALIPFLDDLDETFDVSHFVGRAAGHGPMADRIGSGCFSGRDDELIALTAWMNRDEDGALRVVTGSAGVGKSALIGVLVCAAHPVLRRPTRPLWDRVARVPGQVPHMAAVHARQRGLMEITASFATQLGFEGCASPDDLVNKICKSSTIPMLVVDALDEALEPVVLMNRLLLPLATGRNEDNAPVCRLLVGVRAEPEFTKLRDLAVRESGLIDLDAVSDDRLRRDLEEYVDKLLKSHPYDQRSHAPARAAFAAAVGEALVAHRAGRRWGEFLVAALYTHHLVTTYEAIDDSHLAESLGLQVPYELRDVLELDLLCRTNIPFLRPVLAVLSYALGEGMPASLIREVTPLFAVEGRPTVDDITEALETSRFYLRHTVDSDGTTIYRLFHQGLADYLRQHPVDPGRLATHTAVAQDILTRLLRTLSVSDSNDDQESRQWAFAEPYLLRHVLQHALDARRPLSVAGDPEFLVHADPSVLGSFLSSITNRELAPIAETYRSAVDRQRNLNLMDRRQALALAAARNGMLDLARRLANPTGNAALRWQPVWAVARLRVGSQDSRHHFMPTTSAIVVSLPNGPALIVADQDGTIASWDLGSGKLLNYWLNMVSVTQLRELHLGGLSALLAAVDSRWRMCLDPAGGAEFVDVEDTFLLEAVPGATFEGRDSFAKRDEEGSYAGGNAWGYAVSDKAFEDLRPRPELFSLVGGQVITISQGKDGSLNLIDSMTGAPAGRLVREDTSSVTALASCAFQGRPVLVAGTEERVLELWDLASGTRSDTLMLDGIPELIIPASEDRLVVISTKEILILKRTAALTETG